MTLVQEVQALVRRLREDGTLEPGAAEAVFARIGAESGSLAPQEVRRLQEALAAFEAALHDGRSAVQSRLDHSRRGRRGMRGYGYLKSHKRGQRVRKKA